MRARRTLPLALAGLLLSAAGLAAPISLAAPAPSPQPAPSAADAARGMDARGLVKPRPGSSCTAFELESNPNVCTHGPDPAPAGVDVRRYRTTSELTAGAAAAETTGTGSTDGTGQIVCEGDGVTGKRTQALYVVASDKTDRFSSIAPSIPTWAATADGIYNKSALKTGGARHIRFVTNPDCSLNIVKVVLSPTGDDTFNNTVSELKAQGFNRNDRKYMMWVDANVYCGIGSLYIDDRAGQENYNNTYATYGRNDNGCWNYAEAHEHNHNIGGVQPSAPHSTPNYHCSDEHDEMCYDDDGTGPVVMQILCDSTQARVFDCNNDDYFHTSPPAGSYLASYWNTARSAFLIDPLASTADTTAPATPTGLTATAGTESASLSWTAVSASDLAGYKLYRDGALTATTTSLSLTQTGLTAGQTYYYQIASYDTAGNTSALSAKISVTPTASTTTTTLTASASGTFSNKSKTASLTRTAKAGSSSVYATGKDKRKGTPTTIKVELLSPTGSVVATQTASGTVSFSYNIPATGSYTWRITGASGTAWTMEAKYQG